MATKGEENRARIVDAANELFYTQGFAQTSFADIARATGIPKGNFYFYFPSKDELFAAVLEARVERLRAVLGRWDQEYDDPRDRLMRLAEMPQTDFAQITHYGCPMGSLMSELGKQRADLNRQARRMFDLVLDWSAAQFREILPKGADAGAHARMLLTRLQGASSLAQAYEDESWIADEVAAAKAWIDSL